MERMAISEKLSAEIRRFYHHHFTGRKEAYESQLLSNLPDQLCYQISSLLHSDAVKSVALFDSASIEFLQEVTGKFRHRSYQNGEAIYLQGDICREFLVLLHGSKVNVFFHSRKVPVRALHEGDCYGVNEFLAKRAHSVTLMAASPIHASVMTREQFEIIQLKFADDLRDMKTEAQALWAEDQTMLRRVVRNLEKLKLQPLMMHTPSLFYQRESAVAMVGGSSGVAGRQASRDVYATRTAFANVWNAGVTFWNVYNAFFVIFRIGFHSHLHFSSAVNTAVWVADLSCDLYFALDIYLRLYYFGCSEVGFDNLVERKEVDLRYRRSSTFKWDLLASLPLYVPAASGSLVVSMCRLPRLVRCVDLWVYLDDVIVQVQQHFASRHVSAYLGPIKLMIVLVLVAHCVGCVFVWISELECEHNEQCWLNHDHLLHEYDHAMPILYAKTFYWAITTLLLVGSREIVPRGTAGTLWTAFTCLGCTFVMGHIVGEISELILELGKETKEFKNRIASFESFAKEHALPETLRARVGFFFRVQFEHTEGHGLHHVVHDLSANLRLQLMLEIYGQPIASLPISHLLTSSQINHLALRLQSELFIPGDNILVEGTFANRLCILRKGLAAVFWTKSVASVALLMEGALFGEVAFFLPDQRRLATVRATASCEVLHVSKHDWQELWTANGDSSDSQVQKHALHAVLDWVYYRLQRYQQSCLRTASKAKRVLAVRHDAISLHVMTTTVTAAAKVKAKLLATPLLNYDPASHATVTPTPTQAELLTQPRTIVNAGSFVSPELQALEIKAKYLLMKTDACVKRFHPAIEELGKRPSSGSVVESMARSLRLNDSLRKSGRGSNSGVWRSTQGRTFTPLVERASHKSADIRLRQFIVDLSPVNKHVCGSLSDETVRHLESESWERFRRMAAMQHVVTELQDAVIPPENDFLRLNAARTASSTVAQKIQAARYKTSRLQRSQSVWVSDCASRNSKIQLFGMTPPANIQYPIKPNTALKMPRMFVAAAVRGGHLSTDRGQAQDRRHVVSEQVSTLRRVRRCRSLPLFERDFFERARSDEDSSTETHKRHTRGGNIDFEILQRCQRPQYATQLRLYRRYRRWKDRAQPEETSHHEGINKVKVMPPAHRRLLQLGTFRRQNRQSDNRSTPLAARLQLPSQRTLVAVTSEIETNEFIRFIKKLGKAWELLMLVAAVYNLVVTPFKVCFPRDLSELDGGSLRGWVGLEVLLDVLGLLDVGYRVRYASLMHHSAVAASGSSSQGGLRHVFTADPSLRTDILAILPLELLLLATDVRVPLAYAPSTVAAADWALWTTRWLLRLNRLLFAWRIGPLSEKLLQYAIYDLKLQVSEALVGFLRALASYLTMGHLLACLWFATSELGMHYYGVSWLSTSGMLTYIAPVVATTHGEEAGRALSEATSSVGFLESVALARKYLRSLYFSMECITTLFYGDILSMNPLELVVEIVITFWSIYIYGALVGAQGELLDSRARCEASFEQGLAELQHYLVQNEVPKSLKRQIKAYYAHMWQRGRGADDFAALAGVSRALYEDVVLATLRAFVGRVEAFRALDPPFLRALLVCLQYVVCSEGEQVVTAGDVDRSMYFIAQGSVVVKFDKVETTRERGEFFGELALLYGIARLQTCVALTVAQLYRLDHEPYERLLLDFPEYRARNKLAWATAGSKAPGRAIMTHGVERTAPRDVEPHPVESALISDSTTAEHATDVADYIEAELPHSYIYRSTMTMLAQLNRLDPLEAKDLILKCRGGASRRLRMQFGIASSGGEAANENS
ncbi:hypothetical protein BBJ28_00016425 [Nothophytophthora sp. Chile5]|nr:hypothetical protein BBJ28_00016425 [Nothophytophthora sp. Chile5]